MLFFLPWLFLTWNLYSTVPDPMRQDLLSGDWRIRLQDQVWNLVFLPSGSWNLKLSGIEASPLSGTYFSEGSLVRLEAQAGSSQPWPGKFPMVLNLQRNSEYWQSREVLVPSEQDGPLFYNLAAPHTPGSQVQVEGVKGVFVGGAPAQTRITAHVREEPMIFAPAYWFFVGNSRGGADFESVLPDHWPLRVWVRTQAKEKIQNSVGYWYYVEVLLGPDDLARTKKDSDVNLRGVVMGWVFSPLVDF